MIAVQRLGRRNDVEHLYDGDDVFGRRRLKSRFPADMLDRLELQGRFGLDPMNSGIDGGEIWSRCQAPFLDDVRNDLDGFLADLRALVSQEKGFAALGASCLYFDLVDRSCRTDDALAIIDGGIAFKRARGLPTAGLTGYEWDRWREVHGPDSW